MSPRRKYCHCERDDTARVYLNGQAHYLGRHGSPESYEKYDRLVADHLACSAGTHATVTQLGMAFWKYAKVRYGKSGKGKFGAAINWRPILEMLRDEYGDTLAREFGPKKLKSLIPIMESHGWCRSYLDANLDRVKRIFAWAVSEEMVPADVRLTGSRTKPTIRRGGRTDEHVTETRDLQDIPRNGLLLREGANHPNRPRHHRMATGLAADYSRSAGIASR